MGVIEPQEFESPDGLPLDSTRAALVGNFTDEENNPESDGDEKQALEERIAVLEEQLEQLREQEVSNAKYNLSKLNKAKDEIAELKAERDSLIEANEEINELKCAENNFNKVKEELTELKGAHDNFNKAMEEMNELKSEHDNLSKSKDNKIVALKQEYATLVEK